MSLTTEIIEYNNKKGESMYTTFPRPYKNYVPGQPAQTKKISKTYFDLFQEIEDIAK